MKIFLDDIRCAPEGWAACKWPDEMIDLLKTGKAEIISLDHDLGNDKRGTGYDVLLWIEEAVAINGFVPPEIHIHTANSSALKKMLTAVEKIKELHQKNLCHPQ